MPKHRLRHKFRPGYGAIQRDRRQVLSCYRERDVVGNDRQECLPALAAREAHGDIGEARVGAALVRPEFYIDNIFDKKYLLKGAFFSGASVGRPRMFQFRLNIAQ